MIWHIFKKDLKLLWPLVLIVAALHIINAALQFILGHFGEPRELARIALLLPPAIFLGIAALIVTVVHQDALPGDRQDWLVRPIHRRDLILEKLLFLLVIIHGPMLLADLAQCMATGFTFWGSLSAALSRGAYLLVIFSLPMLALAAMTSTIVEVIGAALAFFLFFFVFQLAAGSIVIGSALLSSGTGWMTSATQSAVFLAAAIAVIPLQYLHRATMRSRSFAIGAVLLLPIFYFIPWTPAFSFQQWLSADPAAAKAVMVAFAPNLGKFTIEPGGRSRANWVWLPLRVSGLPPESFLIRDRAYVRIISREGAILFRGRTTGDPQTAAGPGFLVPQIDDFPVRTTAGGDVRTHELITLPGKIYELVSSQPVRVEFDYSLTLFHIETSDTIAAINGDKWIANFGSCKTKINDGSDQVEFGCILPGNSPCATATLENTVSGQQNPAFNACRQPSYTPITAHPNDALIKIRYDLNFRYPQELAKYPVDSSQLADLRVALKSYQPVAHFTRHLIIPEIRLGDWEAQTPATTTSMAPQH